LGKIRVEIESEQMCDDEILIYLNNRNCLDKVTPLPKQEAGEKCNESDFIRGWEQGHKAAMEGMKEEKEQKAELPGKVFVHKQNGLSLTETELVSKINALITWAEKIENTLKSLEG
jgi:hypothetical protein